MVNQARLDLVKFFLRVSLILLIPVLVGVSMFLYLRGAIEAANPGDQKVQLVQITRDKSFQTFCDELEEKGLIKHAWVLSVIARLRGNRTQIQAGEYEISPDMSPTQILDHLASGKVYLRELSFEPGTSVWELGALLEKAGITTEQKFNQGLVNQELLVRAGIKAESFEGYLFPGKYEFSSIDSVQHIIWTMMQRGEDLWEKNTFTELADNRKFSRHEVLTLASIVQKETADVQEQPILASVFLNRLNTGMRLNADSTVLYGLRGKTEALTDEVRETPAPYNTYTNFGLPPAPICNPGEGAIRAVLTGEKTEFLYFTPNGTGRLVFSTTRREHEQARRAFLDYLAEQEELKQKYGAPEPTPNGDGGATAPLEIP